MLCIAIKKLNSWNKKPEHIIKINTYDKPNNSQAQKVKS